MKKWSVLLLIVPLVLLWMLFDSSDSDNEISIRKHAESNFPSGSSESVPKVDSEEFLSGTANDVQRGASLDNSNVDAEANDVSLGLSPQLDSYSNKFFDKYESESDLNNDFISSAGSIYEATLAAAFKSNFSDFIDTVSTLNKSVEAFENETKISDEISRKLGNKVFDEKLSCAGRLCVVTFKYYENVGKEMFNEIHNFGSFYSFYNYSSNVDDSKQLKLILISTPDSSKLVIER